MDVMSLPMNAFGCDCTGETGTSMFVIAGATPPEDAMLTTGSSHVDGAPLSASITWSGEETEPGAVNDGAPACPLAESVVLGSFDKRVNVNGVPFASTKLPGPTIVQPDGSVATRSSRADGLFTRSRNGGMGFAPPNVSFTLPTIGLNVTLTGGFTPAPI